MPKRRRLNDAGSAPSGILRTPAGLPVTTIAVTPGGVAIPLSSSVPASAPPACRDGVVSAVRRRGGVVGRRVRPALSAGQAADSLSADQTVGRLVRRSSVGLPNSNAPTHVVLRGPAPSGSLRLVQGRSCAAGRFVSPACLGVRLALRGGLSAVCMLFSLPASSSLSSWSRLGPSVPRWRKTERSDTCCG